MKVLIGCEFSGRVRDRFARRGHQAASVDLIPSHSPGIHIIADIRDIISDKWDLLIAFPPCTALCVAGNRWYAGTEERDEALELVWALMEAPIKRIAIENPVGVISTQIRRPDQVIEPWQFGHGWQKTTHLWLKNLPPLQPTNVVPVTERGRIHRAKSGPRAIVRNRTPGGIATAMANQWGNL